MEGKIIMKYKVNSLGESCHRPNDYYDKKVSVAYDSVEYDSDADIKVCIQNEPPCVKPYTSQLILDNSDIFDLIISWNEDFNHLSSFRRCIIGDCWIEWDTFNPDKRNQISYIISDKGWAPGHKVRLDVWDGLDDVESLNGFELLKHKSPPRIENKNFIFENAKYSISIENEQIPNMITEKVIDCFASKTIPIYWGAPNIGDYFNMDAVLTFNNLYELKDILDNLDESYYDDNIDVIEENFERSKQYWDYYKMRSTIIEEFISQMD
tara:strand:+ start:2701 stop:3498 length:798 start_codon:yes stop_codon:yes gene_type:complete